MLTLTRKPGETIVIGEEGHPRQVIITVVSTEKRGLVSLGIDTHESVPVFRGEVYKRRQQIKEALNRDGAMI